MRCGTRAPRRDASRVRGARPPRGGQARRGGGARDGRGHRGCPAPSRGDVRGDGINLLIVVPGSSTSGGVFGGTGTKPTLTWDDLAAIRSEARAVARRRNGWPK
jgi:hypothetical protein